MVQVLQRNQVILGHAIVTETIRPERAVAYGRAPVQAESPSLEFARIVEVALAA